ncbi:DUF4406 domain-containing protein [Pseudomonas aeruginosa]
MTEQRTLTIRACDQHGDIRQDLTQQAEAERPELWAVHAQGPEAEHWKYLAEQEREHVDVARAALAQPSPAGVQLSASRERRIYIAGPMTGYKDYNFPAFNAQAEALRGLGYHVENPADHGVVDGAEWQDYLRYDISRLSTCEVAVVGLAEIFPILHTLAAWQTGCH